MPYGALSPLDYPTELVTIRCDECDRTGRYRRAKLANRFGADTPLPHILNEITQCVRNERLSVEMCRAYYVELRARIDGELVTFTAISRLENAETEPIC